jgi:hypothetical protein
VDLADPANYGRDGSAVKRVELRGDAVHVRQKRRAAAQNAGDRRVLRGGLAQELAQQRDAEQIGFEFIGAQGCEPYAGHDFFSRPLQYGSSFAEKTSL